jgi:hypothetical protein
MIPGSDRRTPQACEVYVEQILAPTLQTGQIVIMENLQAQKAHGSGWPSRPKAVNSSSCLGIPPTSPLLSKRSRSSKPSCDEQEPEPEKPWKRPLRRALLTITAQDAQGWFQHCG